MTIDYESIGKRIRYNRMKNKLSQEQLAELADLSNVFISYLERGERIPSLEAVINIANALNVSVDELLAGNLFVSGIQHNADGFDILFDCSQEESTIIIKCMKALKDILRGYRITK